MGMGRLPPDLENMSGISLIITFSVFLGQESFSVLKKTLFRMLKSFGKHFRT